MLKKPQENVMKHRDIVIFQNISICKSVNVIAFHDTVQADLHKILTLASVFAREDVQMDILQIEINVYVTVSVNVMMAFP